MKRIITHTKSRTGVLALTVAAVALTFSYIQFSFGEGGFNENPFQVVLDHDIPSRTKIGSFIELNNGNVIYARHSPAQPGKSTVVLMNGLPDTLDNWRQLEPDLIEKGYGVIAFDFRGQGNSLAYNYSNFGDLTWQAQVEDVRAMLEFFNLQKVTVAGLSYGGGIAIGFGMTYPEMTEKVVAFAPFVEPVQPADGDLQKKTDAYMARHPEADREKVFEDFFRFNVYSTYPMFEPSVLAHPMKPEAITRLALGIRSMNPFTGIGKLPPGSLTLVGGQYDPSVPLTVLAKLWKVTPKAVKQSFMVVPTGHRITTWRDNASAYIIDQVIVNEKINDGRIYNIDEDSAEFFRPRMGILPEVRDQGINSNGRLNGNAGLHGVGAAVMCKEIEI